MRSSTSTSKSWLPTRKWWSMLVVAVGALAVNWINTGQFTKEIAIALVGLLVQAATTYLIPNQDTPGGVPIARRGTTSPHRFPQ
ncbi:hypothetical protein [Nonomuraea jiangxiensis]|uniref:Holin n=1 Tax=Nonomuraea jiangxiensis TaxID=633440 RepID=A0A1G9P902_9ACTN|nr:hypothetical protein [Nonomuraea jiangxiensis]SDL95043.1 hypothetical protein SAMN05421869_13367 [Nonomuraea jiangxiensis]